MKTPKAKTVEELLAQVRKATKGGSYIFRGENKDYGRISSKLYRYFQIIVSQAVLQGIIPKLNFGIINKKLKKQLGDLAQDIDFTVLEKSLKENIFAQLAQQGEHVLMVERIQKELVLKDVKEYVDFEDEIDTLAALQHYGGSTNRIDFSQDLAVALFFACDGEPEENGRLILLRADDEGVIAPKKNQNNRIVFQKSVFVKRDEGYIEDKDIKQIIIPKNLKSLLLTYVQKYFDIRTETIYGDLMGYIQNQERHSEAYKEFVAGVIHYEEKSFEKSGNCFKKAIKLKPNFFEAHNNLGNAKIKLTPPDSKKAIACYNKAIELNPNFAEGYFNLGMAREQLVPPDIKGAITDYGKAIALNSKYAEAYSKRGIAYGKEKKYDLAIADFGKAIEMNPNGTAAYSNRGLVYSEKGEHDLAIADCNKAIKIDPNDASAYNNRGVAYKNKDNKDLAIADYNKAIEINPNYTIAYNNRGHVYDSKGEHGLAIADFSKAIKIDPNYAISYRNRGIVYANKSDYNLAIADFTQAIALNPKDFQAYYNRGTVYQKKDNKDLAIADYSKAIELNPNDTEAYNNRGIVYNTKGVPDLAIADFNKVIELKPNSMGAYFGRGLSKARKEDFKGARDDLETSLLLAEQQGEKHIADHARKRISMLPPDSDS